MRRLQFVVSFLLFFIAFIIIPHNASSAPYHYAWTETVGGISGDAANAVTRDAQDNIYIAGSFSSSVDFDPGDGVDNHTSNGSSDIFLKKINSDGSYGWTKTLGGTLSDAAISVAANSIGSVYLAGIFRGTVDFDPGSEIDTHNSRGNLDIFITKFNPDGTYAWTKTIGNYYDTQVLSIAVDGSDNIFYTGSFRTSIASLTRTVDFNPGAGVDDHVSYSSSGTDIFLTKLNSDGSYAWTKTIGGLGDDIGASVATDLNGNIYITGSFYSTVDFDPGPAVDNHSGTRWPGDPFFTRFNADGSYGWTKTFSFATGGSGVALAVNSTNDIFVTGYYFAASFDDDCFLVKYSNDGTPQWTKVIDGSSLEHCNDIALDSSDNIYLTGQYSGVVDFDPGAGVDSRPSTGSHNAFISRINFDGSYDWTEVFVGPSVNFSRGNNRGKSLTVDSNDNIYATGVFDRIIDFNPGPGVDDHTSAGSDDSFLLALSPANMPPVAASTNPPDAGMDIIFDLWKIEVSFSEPIDPATINSSTFFINSGGEVVPGTVTYNAGTLTASFDPQSPLSPNTTYTANLTTGVTDSTGLPLNTEYVWTFTTGPLPADGTVKWSSEVHRYYTICTTPAIASDGTVYLGGNGALFAVNPDGTLKWQYLIGGLSCSSPSIGPDGTIYFGDLYNLYAVNPDGTLKWSYPVGEIWGSSPTIGSDGTIYIGTDGAYTHAINPDGTVKWKHKIWRMGEWAKSTDSPLLGLDGTVYYSNRDRIIAVNPDGSTKWIYTTNAITFKQDSGAIGEDGTIYMSLSNGNSVYALNPSGTLKWIHTGSSCHKIVLGADGTIYCGGNAIDKQGVLKWSSTKNILLTGKSNGLLYALDTAGISAIDPTNGSTVWNWAPHSYYYMPSGLMTGPDGILYASFKCRYVVASCKPNILYAVYGNTGGLASSAWPAIYSDSSNTSRVSSSIYTPPPAYDVITDFGPSYGLWGWMNNASWTQLHSVSPEQVVTGDIDGNGTDDVIIDLGAAYGLWGWMNNASWTQLHSVSPEDMDTGDIDGNGIADIIIDFGPSYGLWGWMNNASWTQFHSVSPEDMTTGDIDASGSDDIVIDFGATYGLWAWMNNTTWSQLHSVSPEQIITGKIDATANADIIIDFGAAYGLWAWMNNATWNQLHSVSPEDMATGDIDGSGIDDAIIDFGPSYGLWARMNNTSWVQLHSVSPEQVVTGDMDADGFDDIIIDFGASYGLWAWMNNASWNQLHGLSPDQIVTGEIDGN